MLGALLLFGTYIPEPSDRLSEPSMYRPTFRRHGSLFQLRTDPWPTTSTLSVPLRFLDGDLRRPQCTRNMQGRLAPIGSRCCHLCQPTGPKWAPLRGLVARFICGWPLEASSADCAVSAPAHASALHTQAAGSRRRDGRLDGPHLFQPTRVLSRDLLGWPSTHPAASSSR